MLYPYVNTQLTKLCNEKRMLLIFISKQSIYLQLFLLPLSGYRWAQEHHRLHVWICHALACRTFFLKLQGQCGWNCNWPITNCIRETGKTEVLFWRQMAFKLSNLSLWKQHSILTRPEGFIISLHVITISDFIIWLAPQTGKMTQITRCDCLPERVRCPLGLPAVSHKKKFIRKPYNSSFIDLVCSVKMAGYWCRSGFFFLRVCGPRLRLGP